jgi:hypothetical protein
MTGGRGPERAYDIAFFDEFARAAGLSACPGNCETTVGLLVRTRLAPAESLQTFGSSRAATADRVSLATMLYPFIGLGSRRALFRVVYAGANAAGIDQPAIGIVIGE